MQRMAAHLKQVAVAASFSNISNVHLQVEQLEEVVAQMDAGSRRLQHQLAGLGV